MSVRINQEVLAIATSSVSAAAHVRMNQEVGLIAVPGLTGGHIRVNQAALLIMVPIGGSTEQIQFLGWF